MLRLLVVVLTISTFAISGAEARMVASFGMCEPGEFPAEGANSAANVAAMTTSLMNSNSVRGGTLASMLIRRGRALSAEGDWDRAIADLDASLAELDQLGEERIDARISALTTRGRAYAEKGNYANALRDFDTVLTLRPGQYRDFVDRGVALRLAGEYDRAIEDFNRAILMNVDHLRVGRAFIHRAATYADKGEYDRALTDLYLALKLDCQVLVENNICWIGALSGKPRAAITSQNFFGSALADFWNGRPPSSLYLCNKGETGPASSLDSRAFVFFQLGELAKAQTDSQRAVQMAPNDGELRYMLAMILEAQGDRDGAAGEFAEAERLAKPGQWERWNRQQGRFRGSPATPVEEQAKEVVSQSMVALAKLHGEHPRVLWRLDPQAAPLRVAVLLFPDTAGHAEPRCHKGIADALAKTVGEFNRVLGRSVLTMSDVDHHDVLVVIGGPDSVHGVDVDRRSAEVLAAEQRQTTVPHVMEFHSRAPPHFEPSSWVRAFYRQDTRALLYGVIGHDWRFLDKNCSPGFARDFEDLFSWGPYSWTLKIEQDLGRQLPLPKGFNGLGKAAIETCFVAGPNRTAAEQWGCVKGLIALTAESSE